MNPSLPVTNLKKLVSVETLALVAIAIAILLRILNLGSREFWYDEVLSLLLSTGQKSAYQTPRDLPVLLADYTSLLSLPVESSLSDILLTLKNLIVSLFAGEPHPPIFFLTQHLWLRLFGNSEVAMRSLNALFSIAAILSGYSLGKVLLNHRGGLLLAALIGMNPFYLFHSLNFRMYAPLVLWTTLSATALLNLINRRNTPSTKISGYRLWWNILLIGSVATGLLTFYLYGYWVITLAVLVLYLDRKHWWEHGLRLATGVMITIPWLLSGGFKQLSNADLNRFGSNKGVITAFLSRLEGIFNTVGANLLLGDWVTSLPAVSVTVFGGLVISFIVTCSISLWRKGHNKNLSVALILGILPLLLGLAVDIATQKYTLGFGWGRTMMMILPGCLLLFVVWLEEAVSRQSHTLIASALLLLYLTIGISDFSLRQRSVFHTIANVVTQDINQPTLIAMNSKAWGHIMRLAYYIPPNASVMLLAEHPKDLADSLAKVLKDNNSKYERVLWLDSANPLWSPLKTETEINTEQEKTQQLLSQQFRIQESQNLIGTMNLDNFNIKLYTRSSKS